ncbi:Transient receptor potential cation channel subfamily A member 1 [Paramuricea clavata]|nr:Transient receptor potential cation channel subfamily A member 1 [Paramuricea clavata]
MAYAILVIGEIVETKDPAGKIRVSTAPDAPVTMALRIILLIITFAAMVKDIFQIKMQRFRYFTKLSHYLEMAMHIMVILFLLPVNKILTKTHIGAGAFAVLYSWMTLIQYLKVVPVMGIYIIVVQTIFWTLMKGLSSEVNAVFSSLLETLSLEPFVLSLTPPFEDPLR